MNWLSSKLYDPFMRHCEKSCLRDWRRELLAEAQGQVVEVGAGTGANLEFYPDDVDQVLLTEPDPHMRRQLQQRLDREEEEWEQRFDVDQRPVEQLDSSEAQFDAAVVTLVMCSVDEPKRALNSVYRALKPGGKLIFMEHVGAERAGRQRIQKMMEPVWKLCAGNCHLTRRTGEVIEQVGFELETMQREEMDTLVPFLRPSVRGVARRPD